MNCKNEIRCYNVYCLRTNYVYIVYTSRRCPPPVNSNLSLAASKCDRHYYEASIFPKFLLYVRLSCGCCCDNVAQGYNFLYTTLFNK